MREFYKDMINSREISRYDEIKQLYEYKLNSKIIERIEIKNRKQQKAGYDIELHLDDRILTIEEKFRLQFFPDILLEIKHINGFTDVGWLYHSEAEVLAYFQLKENDWTLSLYNLKKLAEWTKTNDYLELLNSGIIKEIWSSSHKNNTEWLTMNHAIPFHILRKYNFNYRNKKYEKDKKILPLDFY